MVTMVIDLRDPEWVAVLLTAFIATVAATFALSKLLHKSRQSRVKRLGGNLSEDQLFALLAIYQDSVGNEITKILFKFIYDAHTHGRAITEDALEQLRTEAMTLIRVRREQLRFFHTPAGRLDEVVARIYEPQIETDSLELKRIALSDQPHFDRLRLIEEAVKSKQVALRRQLEQNLSVVLRRK
jgi:hypothetical protein